MARLQIDIFREEARGRALGELCEYRPPFHFLYIIFLTNYVVPCGNGATQDKPRPPFNGGVNGPAHFKNFSGQFGLIWERFENVIPLYLASSEDTSKTLAFLYNLPKAKKKKKPIHSEAILHARRTLVLKSLSLLSACEDCLQHKGK